jgi:hypothetical protein
MTLPFSTLGKWEPGLLLRPTWLARAKASKAACCALPGWTAQALDGPPVAPYLAGLS